MAAKALITLKRQRGLADRFRTYEISLDGILVESVRYGGSASLSVSAGEHVLRLSTELWVSKDVSFVARPGECIAFACGNRLTGWRLVQALLYRVFLWAPNLDIGIA